MCKTPAAEHSEVEELRGEIDQLRRELSDMQNALLTSNEHGDLLQEHLYALSCGLTTEVQQRKVAEDKLQRLLQAMTREKSDLEVMLQILIDQGDTFAEEGKMARMDALMRIPNRRGLDECLLREWRRHARLQLPLSFLLCDIDHFKLYNDNYGHQSGDECLTRVAHIITQCLRRDDFAARYGGEEVAVIMPHTGPERAVQIGEQIRLTLAAAAIPHTNSPIHAHVTLSVGVAGKIPGKDVPDAHALIQEADRNLYLAKREGRDRVNYQRTGTR